MRKKYIGKNRKLTFSLFIVLLLISCNKSPQKPNINKKEGLPRLPKVLTELEDEILKTMYDLDSITGIEKAIEEEKLLQAGGTATKLTEQEQSNKNTEKNKKEEKQTEKTVDMQELIAENEIIIPLLKASEVKGNFSEDSATPPDIDTVWIKINDGITGIHKKWNILESQLPSEKISLAKTEEFEKILNDLTLFVVDKKKFDSIMLTNELTRVTTNFRSYFDGIANHDVYRMYYHIRATILSAASDNYVEAISHLNETGKIGDSIRRDLIKKDSEDILKKFELSIEDLGDQLVDENFYLSQIKAPIVIKNIKLIQDVLETEK